ncbi:esterase-like activity of phytase family protein [Variovorax boronicumulans]|uniref:esterase-like activity of phytase family protein n=1 Tax=Variovorax boronicumulans TaxID=436515 RepID=UPI0012E52CF9|nr:esterase-like activity of phytase family protein [Variovorax boronicumulans]GER10488.1 hypothetical protein VHAB30_16450 [Variovorax boronicumulans]
MGWLALVGAGAVLTACGGGNGGGGGWSFPVGGGTTNPPAAQSKTGTFLDAAVEGLDYVAGSAPKAATNAKGEFICKDGETVTFSAGALALGSAACGEAITPLTLAGGSDVKADAVVNRLLALQSFDEDRDPANGIRLTPALKAALTAGALDFNASPDAFHTALNAVLAALPAPYNARMVDSNRRMLAREHFEDTLASRLAAPVTEASTQTNQLGAIGIAVTRYQLQADTRFHVPYEGDSTDIKADFPQGFLPAYGSGLAFKGKADDGALEFYAITDRGPNGDGPTAPVPGGGDGVTSISKVFPAPSFAPSFGIVRVGKTGAVLSTSVPLKRDANTKITGLPPRSGVGSTGETPLTDQYKFDEAKAGYDANGLDPETLVLDKARNVLWTSDEYGPFIARLNIASGVVEKKYAPGPGATDLPAVLAQRRPNRGMEGLTLDVASGVLHGFLQSPIDPRDANGKSIKAKPPGGSNTDVRHIAKFTRWLAFDPATETSKLYAYPIDGSQYDKDRTGNAKLGDMVSLGNGRFIVIEQGARKGDGKVFNKLMLVELPANATNIAAPEFNHNLEISSITQAPSNGVDYSTVVTMRKTELLDLNLLGWLAEKAEGLTVVDDQTLALVNDNDFGLGTVLLGADGTRLAGSVEECKVDVDGKLRDCPAGATEARITRGSDLERPTRIWLIKLDRKLSDLRLPAS